MDFSFSDDQELLREVATRFAREHFGPDAARRTIADSDPADGRHWKEIADLGWLGLAVPAEAGGAGGSIADACIVAEALAHHLAPVGYAGQAIAAAAALRWAAAGESDDLAALAAGEPYAVVLDADLSWPPRGDRGIVWDWQDGAVPLVATPHGFEPVRDASPTERASADLLRRLAELPLTPAGCAVLGEGEQRFLAAGLVATCASLLGSMRGALEAALEHVKVREQFGRPVGSFQAVQHIGADMLLDVETSTSITYAAAWAVDALEAGEALRLAATAKTWCGPAAIRVCESALQLHGGMGYTWEAVPHLFLRQAHLARAAFGDEYRASALVARSLFGAGEREGQWI